MTRYLILFLLCFRAVCFANLASETVFLTWQKDPDTTMMIQWLTPLEHEDDSIQYRIKDEYEWNSAPSINFPFPNTEDLLFHRVELLELKPDTEYEFKFHHDDEKIYLFKTMQRELDYPLKFVVGGDMYHDDTPEFMGTTCRQAAQTDPDFAMLGGDIAYAVATLHSGERMGRWVEWIKTWSSCMITEKGKLIPVIAAIGNHDLPGQYDQTPAQAKVFCCLFPMPENSVYRVLDFGSYLSLFLLDSGHANAIDKNQVKWLKSNLETRHKMTHKLAAYHVPAYPSIRKFNNARSVAIRKSWVPLFEDHGIQLVFEHHDHAYKRTFPLLMGKAHPEGIVYLGDGAWSVDKARDLKSSKRLKYIARFVPSRHFMLVTLTQNEQHVLSISDEGEILDEYKKEVPKLYKRPKRVEEAEEKASLFQRVLNLVSPSNK